MNDIARIYKIHALIDSEMKTDWLDPDGDTQASEQSDIMFYWEGASFVMITL